jgi:hypothetical protein
MAPPGKIGIIFFLLLLAGLVLATPSLSCRYVAPGVNCGQNEVFVLGTSGLENAHAYSTASGSNYSVCCSRSDGGALSVVDSTNPSCGQNGSLKQSIFTGLFEDSSIPGSFNNSHGQFKGVAGSIYQWPPESSPSTLRQYCLNAGQDVITCFYRPGAAQCMTGESGVLEIAKFPADPTIDSGHVSIYGTAHVGVSPGYQYDSICCVLQQGGLLTTQTVSLVQYMGETPGSDPAKEIATSLGSSPVIKINSPSPVQPVTGLNVTVQNQGAVCSSSGQIKFFINASDGTKVMPPNSSDSAYATATNLTFNSGQTVFKLGNNSPPRDTAITPMDMPAASLTALPNGVYTLTTEIYCASALTDRQQFYFSVQENASASPVPEIPVWLVAIVGVIALISFQSREK